MAEYRVLSANNKYYLPKETLLMVIHFCKQYNLWKQELAEIDEEIGGPNMSEDGGVKSSNKSDPTARLAERREKITRKIDLVEGTAELVAEDLREWLLLGVCQGRPYHWLKHQGIPCGKDLYYLLRRRFYYELARRL